MKRLIIWLLTILGFGATACDEIIPAAEYGTPHVNFNLKARVIDQAGNPIQGIEVCTKESGPFENRTGFSDYLGNIDAHGSIWPGSQYEVVFQDVDGEANGGEYERLELNISGKVQQINEGSGNWYEGGFQAKLGDITMKIKESEENNNKAE